MPQTIKLVPLDSTPPLQLSDEQQQDLNDGYDAQEKEWIQKQEYMHDRYLYIDK